MVIDLTTLSPNQIYYTMMQTLIPRPIAWVLTKNKQETYNLAPFSYFNGISSDPPLVLLSISKKDANTKKDTWINIEERDDFVIHIPDEALAEKVNASSKNLPYGVSEIEELGIELEFLDPKISYLPIIKKIKVAFICKKYQIIEIGNTPQGLILGLVQYIYIDDSCITNKENNKIFVDPMKMNPLARLGASTFSTLGKILHIKRPK
ncbi:MAG: flavin reductase family protein [Leptonema sp. (in: bacteria)]